MHHSTKIIFNRITPLISNVVCHNTLALANLGAELSLAVAINIGFKLRHTSSLASPAPN